MKFFCVFLLLLLNASNTYSSTADSGIYNFTEEEKALIDQGRDEAISEALKASRAKSKSENIEKLRNNEFSFGLFVLYLIICILSGLVYWPIFFILSFLSIFIAFLCMIVSIFIPGFILSYKSQNLISNYYDKNNKLFVSIISKCCILLMSLVIPVAMLIQYGPSIQSILSLLIGVPISILSIEVIKQLGDQSFGTT